jgi:riboflavin kinase/FMN adenylyltransferase
MKIIRNFSNISSQEKNTVLALGNFDGLHLGHQKILTKIQEIAKNSKKKTAIMSFEPHPYIFFNKARNFNILSLQDKITLLKNSNIDYFYLVRFDKKFANITANEFINQILIKKLAISHLVIGYDFIFGKNRAGNADLLRSQSENHHISFTQISSHISSNGAIYSSTEIRKSLTLGEIEKVSTMLGRNYFIKNRVIEGKKIARDLGYPTANITLNNLYYPKFGVYAVKTHIKNKIFNAIANIGIKPTISNKNTPILEVHIFNFDANLYGQKIKIEFISFLREEEKFDNIEKLQKQITLDINQAKKILKC